MSQSLMAGRLYFPATTGRPKFVFLGGKLYVPEFQGWSMHWLPGLETEADRSGRPMARHAYLPCWLLVVVAIAVLMLVRHRPSSKSDGTKSTVLEESR